VTDPRLNPAYLRSLFPRSPAGDDLLALGYYFSFHFPDGHRADRRERVAAVCRNYWRRFGSHLRWMIEPPSNRWRAVEGAGDFDRWVAAFPPADWAWSLIFHSAPEQSAAAEYSLLGVGTSTEVFSYSNLYLTVGLAAFEGEAAANPIDLYRHWAEVLQPRFGSAGFGLIPPEDTPRRARTAPQAAAFGRQFPGVELVDAIGNQNAFSGLLAANWLNVVDDDCVERLGGLSAVNQRLAELPGGDRIGVEPYPGGLLLQAGESPLLNEPGQPGQVPAVYQPVARLLRPLRTLEPWGCWGCPRGESLDWLARFD